MARLNHNNKWYPVVYDNGFIVMSELINDKWTYIECDTKEEAEQIEKEYYNSRQK